jgi:hypothetical protein
MKRTVSSLRKNRIFSKGCIIVGCLLMLVQKYNIGAPKDDGVVIFLARR